MYPLPQAVIFDWDNTLVSSWECIHAALHDTLRAMGKPVWSFDETCRMVRQPLTVSFPIVFEDEWRQAEQVYYQRYQFHADDRLKPLPGARDLLSLLREKEIYVCLVSNKLGALLRQEVKILGWQDLLGRQIGAGDAEQDKPSTAPVILALQDTALTVGDFASSQVWFIGDTSIDMECAKACGCLSILVGQEDFLSDLRFQDCSALIHWVLTLG